MTSRYIIIKITDGKIVKQILACSVVRLGRMLLHFYVITVLFCCLYLIAKLGLCSINCHPCDNCKLFFKSASSLYDDTKYALLIIMDIYGRGH